MTTETAPLIAQLLVVVLFCAGLLFFVVRYQAHQPPRNLHESEAAGVSVQTNGEAMIMQRTIDELSATVNTLRRQLDNSDRRIAQLEAENVGLKCRVAELEAQLKAQTLPMLPTKPLLIISGTDITIFERDRSALRRADVPFHRLINATQASITAELRRRRQDNTLYPWLLISAHAGPEGVLLVDGIAPPEFWHNVLDGVRVVVLATCSSSAIADELAGLVDTVVWFAEDVESQAAADFNQAFWRRMKLAANTHVVFAEALREVPSVAEFVDIRTS